ncbi:hypothetical protein VNN36_12450 (plasmid) [Lactococcus garvieae]
MITLYYSLSSTSSKQAMDWFEARDMEICKKRGSVAKFSDTYVLV